MPWAQPGLKSVLIGGTLPRDSGEMQPYLTGFSEEPAGLALGLGLLSLASAVNFLWVPGFPPESIKGFFFLPGTTLSTDPELHLCKCSPNYLNEDSPPAARKVIRRAVLWLFLL